MAKKGSFYNNGPHILPTMGESIALKNTTFSLQPRAHWLIQVRDLEGTTFDLSLQRVMVFQKGDPNTRTSMENVFVFGCTLL